jgi:hypothetical protein
MLPTSSGGRTARWCCAGSPPGWAKRPPVSPRQWLPAPARPAGRPPRRCHTDQGGCRLITRGPPPKFHGGRDILPSSTGAARVPKAGPAPPATGIGGDLHVEASGVGAAEVADEGGRHQPAAVGLGHGRVGEAQPIAAKQLAWWRRSPALFRVGSPAPGPVGEAAAARMPARCQVTYGRSCG